LIFTLQPLPRRRRASRPGAATLAEVLRDAAPFSWPARRGGSSNGRARRGRAAGRPPARERPRWPRSFATPRRSPAPPAGGIPRPRGPPVPAQRLGDSRLPVEDLWYKEAIVYFLD